MFLGRSLEVSSSSASLVFFLFLIIFNLFCAVSCRPVPNRNKRSEDKQSSNVEDAVSDDDKVAMVSFVCLFVYTW